MRGDKPSNSLSITIESFNLLARHLNDFHELVKRRLVVWFVSTKLQIKQTPISNKGFPTDSNKLLRHIVIIQSTFCICLCFLVLFLSPSLFPLVLAYLLFIYILLVCCKFAFVDLLTCSSFNYKYISMDIITLYCGFLLFSFFF